MSSVMRTAPPRTRTNPSSSEFAALHHKDQPRDAAKPTTWHTGHPYAGLRLWNVEMAHGFRHSTEL